MCISLCFFLLPYSFEALLLSIFLVVPFLVLVDLLLVSAILMELAAQSSKGIKKDVLQLPEELSPFRLSSSCCSCSTLIGSIIRVY